MSLSLSRVCLFYFVYYKSQRVIMTYLPRITICTYGFPICTYWQFRAFSSLWAWPVYFNTEWFRDGLTRGRRLTLLIRFSTFNITYYTVILFGYCILIIYHYCYFGYCILIIYHYCTSSDRWTCFCIKWNEDGRPQSANHELAARN
jgi:hypothetical protein